MTMRFIPQGLLIACSVFSLGFGPAAWAEILSPWQLIFLFAYSSLTLMHWKWKSHWILWLTHLAFFAIHAWLVLSIYLPKEKVNLAVEDTNLHVCMLNVLRVQEDYDKVLQYLQRNPFDLVALMEVPQTLKRRLPELQSAFPFVHSEQGWELVILSRRPFHAASSSKLPHERLALWVDLDYQGKAFQFLCLHNYKAGTKPHLPILQALADLAQQEPNLVIAADLNATPWSPGFRTLLQDGGLRHARQGVGILASWRWPPIPWITLPLDHFLFKGHLSMKNLRLGPDVGSDHLPLVAELILGEDRS